MHLKNIYNSTKAKMVIVIIVLLLIGFGIYHIQALNKAHSTLENYAVFRGCISLSNQTATSADCVLPSNKTERLVKINNKWYLEGDGPGVF
jgi:uncharacterized membrane protein affecting hemolysin expression